MVSEQIHHFEEGKRLAISVAQPKQGAWTGGGGTPRTGSSHGATSSKWSLNN